MSITSVQLLIRVRPFATPWTAARQASLSITNSQSLLRLMAIELVMPSHHLILCRLQSFPASGFFPVSQLFTSGGQSIGASASASALPVNSQDSLQSKGLSRVFSNTTVQKHPFFGTQLSLWSKFPRWRTQEPVWNSVIPLQVLPSHHLPYQMPMLSTSLSIHI